MLILLHPPPLLKPSGMVFTAAELPFDRSKLGYTEPQKAELSLARSSPPTLYFGCPVRPDALRSNFQVTSSDRLN